jgi:hypothetical protein
MRNVVVFGDKRVSRSNDDHRQNEEMKCDEQRSARAGETITF